jgi:hypothetical protein
MLAVDPRCSATLEATLREGVAGGTNEDCEPANAYPQGQPRNIARRRPPHRINHIGENCSCDQSSDQIRVHSAPMLIVRHPRIKRQIEIGAPDARR